MTKIVIKEIVFDTFNIDHIKKHNVTRQEVEHVGKNFIYHIKTHTNRYLAAGRVGSRIITIIIRRIHKGTYYVVTARDSSKKERRRFYEKENKIKNT